MKGLRVGNLVAVISLLSLLIGCNAETAEFFCDAPAEGYASQTVIVDYERGTAARCPPNMRCFVGDDAKFVGDLVIFTTEFGRNQLNTETGEYISGSIINYQCRRQYF